MITTLEAVVDWLGPGHEADDPVVIDAYSAAEAYVSKRVRYAVINPLVTPPEPLDAPSDLKLAVALQTQRLLARRNAPDAMVGLGEIGFNALPVSDADIAALIGPWRAVVT